MVAAAEGEEVGFGIAVCFDADFSGAAVPVGVGADVGAAEGSDVGSAVGSAVWSAVGDAVGDAVGVPVAVAAGAGVPVGDPVGVAPAGAAAAATSPRAAIATTTALRPRCARVWRVMRSSSLKRSDASVRRAVIAVGRLRGSA